MSRQKHDITAGGDKDCEIDILGGNDIIKGGCARQAIRKCKMQFLNKNLYGARTVSYTHLDVYKRQVQDYQHAQGQRLRYHLYFT